jgi:glucosylceramidase
MVPVSPNSYLIASFKSSKAVDVPGHSMANNTQIVQWKYNGGANQHWRINEIGNNDYTIESVESGKLLDVLNASTDNGAPVQQYGYG